ncbi:MAG TPA: hypothetical protein VHW64_14140 [Nocardioides sp.]|uniref:hypothetical protein n=1 Tax=Nocardioides sp. TaxID=35761 RepID=UPI002E31C89A|nr:hypothetical protein [Nocardioides sp.]HEX3931841.1 hypothetical protein [Nocardioides sp.]
MQDAHGHRVPPPLVVAAGLTAVEGVLVLVYAVLEAASVHSDRLTMGVTTAVFFAALGAGLVAGAWYLAQGRTWARSPVVVAQIMALGLAWSFAGGSTTWVSVLLGVVGLVVLAGILHPASMAALGDRPADR